MLEEQRLNSKIHNCAAFDSGTPELNDYLTRRATQDRRRNLSQVYVLVDADEPTRVLGYYTLSAAQVEADQISEQERRRLPRYPIPCFRMGRFAVEQTIQGQGLGKRLLGCAVDRCLHARREVAAYALIVDAKDADAKSFYEYFGFVAFADKPQSLYLALGR
ncbi:MAG: GNAT family N-acetyltransferase [Proteobacteria bacterium]|nr:GNAT family N-acetyltransferase [Pseudomonadota bacterium]MDA0994184.1 GNAT family N-acetyltransferase [Pseudomonadota bacterium]